MQYLAKPSTGSRPTGMDHTPRKEQQGVAFPTCLKAPRSLCSQASSAAVGLPTQWQEALPAGHRGTMFCFRMAKPLPTLALGLGHLHFHSHQIHDFAPALAFVQCPKWQGHTKDCCSQRVTSYMDLDKCLLVMGLNVLQHETGTKCNETTHFLEQQRPFPWKGSREKQLHKQLGQTATRSFLQHNAFQSIPFTRYENASGKNWTAQWDIPDLLTDSVCSPRFYHINSLTATGYNSAAKCTLNPLNNQSEVWNIIMEDTEKWKSICHFRQH